MARLLSKLLDAPLVLQRYSRLAYDCNRPPESTRCHARGERSHRNSRQQEPERRLTGWPRVEAFYRPFHAGLAHLLDQRACAGRATSLVTIHSFTKIYKGKDRAVELGMLFDRDSRIADKLIKGFPKTDARLNEPYGPKDGVHAYAQFACGTARLQIRDD